MPEFSFTLSTNLPGWVRIDIASGESQVTADCSNSRDTIGDLMRGLARLVRASGNVEIVCDTESQGIALLTFHRADDRLEISAKHERGLGEVARAQHRRARLRHCGAGDSDLRQIASSIQGLIEMRGAAGYETS